MDRNELKAKLIKETEETYQYGCRKLGIVNPPVLTVSFDLTGVVAGRACYDNNIQYNLDLVIAQVDDFFSRTVPHEVAHRLADMKFYGRQGHNNYWAYVMAVCFNLQPIRCHQYAMPENNYSGKTYYNYTCRQCRTKFIISAKVHSSLQSRSSQYRCNCGSTDVVYTSTSVGRSKRIRGLID